MPITYNIQKNNVIKINGTTATLSKVTDKHGVLRHVIWNGPTTDAHKVELQDKDGNVIWADEFRLVKSTNGGARTGQHDMNYNLGFDGLWVSDLDSGNLLLVVEQLTD